MKRFNIHRAVIFSSRPAIINAIRSELKRSGLDNQAMEFPKTATECVEALQDLHEKPLLVIDWDEGVDTIIQVLSGTKQKNLYEAVPIFLIATESDEGISQLATEFGVRRVHVGDVSQTTIRQHIETIFGEQAQISPIRRLLVEAMQLRTDKAYQEALNLLKEAWHKEPTNLVLGCELADTYFAVENTEQALKIAKKLLQKHPDDIRIINILGRCHLARGEHEIAISYLEKAHLLNPYNPDRLVDLGTSFLNTGKLEEASQCFDEAQALDGNHKQAKFGKGTINLMKGEINEALNILSKFSTRRELASIFNTAAILTIKSGMVSKGLGLYDAALNAIQGDAIIQSKLHFNKGLGYLKNKQKFEAEEAFSRALSLDPENEKAQRQSQALKGKATPKRTAAASIDSGSSKKWTETQESNAESSLGYDAYVGLDQAIGEDLIENGDGDLFGFDEESLFDVEGSSATDDSNQTDDGDKKAS